MFRPTLKLAGAVLAAALITVLAASLAFAGRSELNAVRAATARFHSLAQAEAAGYGQPPAPAPLHYCISDLNGMGAMGYHYINGALLSGDEAGRAVPEKPEVLVYEPDSHGNLHLVALEYVIFKADWTGGGTPSLFGRTFDSTNAPNRYEIPAFYSLHVWLYKDNPDPVAGIFAPMNMNVSCN
jgi:hypothetical protein